MPWDAFDKRESAESVHKEKLGLAGTTRGSPSLVNGVRLRTSSLRGSRVRIPPPAPVDRLWLWHDNIT